MRRRAVLKAKVSERAKFQGVSPCEDECVGFQHERNALELWSVDRTLHGEDVCGRVGRHKQLHAGRTSLRTVLRNAYRRGLVTSITNVAAFPVDGEMLAHEDWRYYYDAKSRLVSVSEWRYSDLENPYPTDWVEVVVLSNRYDHLDRPIQKITPEAMHTYFYEGWLLEKEVVANTNDTTEVIEP